MPVERIDLWVVDLDRWSGTAPDPALLTDQDRARAARLRDPVAGRRLLARRAATRSVVAGELALDVGELVIDRRCPTCGGSDHGRPFVRGADRAFSVSSSGPIAAIAVSGQPVGVDVELLRADVTPAATALCEREQRALRTPDAGRSAGEAFLRLWTAKEAVLKAGGQGLADDPSRIDATGLLTADSATVVGDGRPWVVQLLAWDAPPGDPLVLAVADAVGAEVVRRTVGDR